MNEAGKASESSSESSAGTNLTRTAFQRFLAGVLLAAAVLFAASGRIDWVAAWIYLLLYAVTFSCTLRILLRKQPDLIVERMQAWKGAKKWDRPFVIVMAGIGPIALLVIAGLEARWRWPSPIPFVLQVCGAAAFLFGSLLASWAIAVNRFFSSVVRIQKDRGHVVVSRGPYRFVRHPGYASVILTSPATSLLLGSLWSLIPALIVAGCAVGRTALEDKTLQNELEGYREYAGRVRYRLVPGVW